MATTLFLIDTASDLGGAGQKKISLGVRGSGVVSKVTNTVAGTGGTFVQVTDGAGGTALTWFTAPLNAVTISAVTPSPGATVWGLESSTMANVQAALKVERCDGSGTVISTILPTAGTAFQPSGSEYGTAASAQVAGTIGVNSTTLSAGDRIKVTLYGSDSALIGNMASGFTFTTSYNGASASANGDTFVTFTETITEQTAAAAAPPRPTVLLQAVGRAASW